MRTNRWLLGPALCLALAACDKGEPQKVPVPPPPPKVAEPSAVLTKTASAAEVVALEKTAADTIPGKSGIAGVVRFEGASPAPRKLDMSKDKACVKASKDAVVQEVEVSDGKLKGVFVYVKSGLGATKFPARTEKVVLDQKGCAYSPTVLGLQVGQTLEIVNSDPFLHNVHGMAKVGEFNQAMPKQGQKIERKMKKEQVPVLVKCEVHPWMQAWIGVVDHPFFQVTDANGAFAFEGVPAGSYEVEFFHPTLGTSTQKVEVKDGAATSVSTVFKPRA